jgi:hypothetical protein
MRITYFLSLLFRVMEEDNCHGYALLKGKADDLYEQRIEQTS